MKPAAKYVEALKDEPNWIGAGVVVAGCFFAGLPLAIPFALGAYEAAYLLFVPDTPWFARRRQARAAAADAERRRALRDAHLPRLLAADRRRFEQLEQLAAAITAEAAIREEWYAEIVQKLRLLEERFLVFGARRAEYLGYLLDLAERERVVPVSGEEGPAAAERRARQLQRLDSEALIRQILEHYDRRIARARKELDQETHALNQEVLRKNLDVVCRLRENAAEIGQIARNLARQMDLVADTFTLVNGQVRTHPPEQMLGDVDEVVGSSQVMTEALAEVGPLQQMVQRLGR